MKKWIIRLGGILIPICIFITIILYGYFYSTFEVSDTATLIFSDSDDSTALFKSIAKNLEFITLDATQFYHNSNHTHIVLLGIRDSPSGKIIAGQIGKNFKKEYNVTTILKNGEQEIIIYYAQTENDLLSLIALSTQLQNKTPAKASSLIAVRNVPYERSNILGAVVGCTQVTMVEYLNAIIDNKYQLNNEDYVRHQMYYPFASSTFQNLALKPGQEGAKQLAKSILEDVAGQELFHIFITCTKCGQETMIPMKATDYISLQEDILEWKAMLQQDICSSCPGSEVSISYEIVDTMDIYGLSVDLSKGTIDPSGVLDELVGKQADVYDNLPKSYSYTQTCPDNVPRIIIAVLLPVFKDWQGNFIEPEYNWQNMEYIINTGSVGSYSNPVSFNEIAYLTPLNIFIYTFYPQYNVYTAGHVSSSPPEIIEEQEGYYYGFYYLSPPMTYELNKENYVFDHWEINGVPYPSSEAYKYMMYEPFYAIAYYHSAGSIEKIDLTVTDISIERIEQGYNLTFLVFNNGWNASNEFDYDVYIDNRFLTHGLLSSLSPHSFIDTTLLFNVNDICYDSKDQHNITVVIDSQYAIAETNELNNEESVIVQKDKPNLVVYDYLVNVKHNNGTSTLDFTVLNHGYVNVSYGLYITVSSGNKKLDEIYYNKGIAAEKNATFTLTYPILDIFTNSNSDAVIEIFADSTWIIDESFEKDNIAEKRIERTGPDLIIEDVDNNPHKPSKSEEVIVSVLVKNIGETTAESGTAEVYYSDGKKYTESIANLEPGKNITVNFSRIVDCGKHVFHATLSNVVPLEYDRWNNGMYNNEFRVRCEETEDNEETSAEEENNETTIETTCEDACPGTGMCMGGGCTYSISYHETQGDAWCISQHDYAYSCCCIISQ